MNVILECPPRDDFLHLGEDTAALEETLAQMNEALTLLPDYVDDREQLPLIPVGESFQGRSIQLRASVGRRAIQVLRPDISGQLEMLNGQYEPLRNRGAMITWAVIAASAPGKEAPVLFHANGGGALMPGGGNAFGCFDGFNVLGASDSRAYLYMRANQGGRLYWTQPTLKVFA